MHANNREEIKEAFAGDIVALVGLKDTTTGDTLCDAAKPIILEPMEFPDPVIEVAVEPQAQGRPGEDGHGAAAAGGGRSVLPRRQRPGDRARPIITGMGELHLEILVDRMKREFKVEANVGAPQVAYRETITKRKADIDYTHKKQSGGSGQFARVKLVFEPRREGQGLRVRCKVIGGTVPKEYIPGVEKGLNSADAERRHRGLPDGRPAGPLSTAPTTRSTARRWRSRSRLARRFKEGVAKAEPDVLEPVMEVEVVTPEDYMGDVIGDLNSRRGQITGMEPRGNAPGDQRASCRWPRCSATSTRCARSARAAPSSRCTSTTTSLCRRWSRKKSAQSTPEPARRVSQSELERWARKNFSGRSRTATLARLAMLIMARRR